MRRFTQRLLLSHGRWISTLLCLASSSCAAPRIAITAVSSGPLELGPNRKLVLFAGLGPKELRDEAGRELAEQIRKVGYFTMADRSREGAPPVITSSHIEWAMDDALLSDDATGLRLDVSERLRPCGEEPGVAEARSCEASLVVTVQASAFASDGRLLVKEQAFSAEVKSPADRNRAIASVIAAFLKAATPVEITRYVALDDRDSGQRRILATAAGGDIAHAREELRFYLEQNPENAPAAYNLAVLTEALSGCNEALSLYDRALTLKSDPRYAETRAACAPQPKSQE